MPAAYDWDPATVVKEIPETAIIGIEAPLWSETAANMRDVEWLAFPRLAAIAEIALVERGAPVAGVRRPARRAGAALDGARDQLLSLAEGALDD